MRYGEIVERMRSMAKVQPHNRRTFVFGGSAVAGALAARPLFAQTPSAPVATPVFGGSPFSLGIASGEPLPDGVVLWTRLAPQPFEPNGGMPDSPVEVRWQIANDDAMTEVVQEGVALAEPAWGHSLHVEVEGLEANRWYWYRFTAGNEESPIGRTKTAPAAGTDPGSFRFAFASCQRWDQGLYTAYRDLAQQEVDLVVHLGDYIYEYNVGFGDLARPVEIPGHARTQPKNLEQYRFRYAMYKLDEHLQEAHRVTPWMVTWDDHEVQNNFFGNVNRDLPAAQGMLLQRAAAYQAYYEHMPLRKQARVNGPDLQLFRHRTFGSLVDFNVLDTRQYRTSQAPECTPDERLANDGFCSASLDPERSMLGERQRGWLLDRFDQTTAWWSVLAQQVPFARVDNEADPALASYGGREMDKWDGYAHERDVISAAMAAAAKAKGFAPVVITGDVHANYVWDLMTDWDDTSGATAYGTEFVGTSISSNGNEALEEDGGFTTECGNRNGNAHNHLYDNHRGYVVCNLTADIWESTYRVMPNVSDPDAEASTLVSFAVEHAKPGAQVATSCTPEEPSGS
jgi:alkaline phosphatase D